MVAAAAAAACEIEPAAQTNGRNGAVVAEHTAATAAMARHRGK